MKNDEKTVLDSVKQILAETEGATAGPWVSPWELPDTAEDAELNRFIAAGGECVVGFPVEYHPDTLWCTRENARLIAAAPDMRALLERVGSLLGQLHPLAVTASSSTGAASEVRAARDELVRVCLELGGEA
jgi:hypothetical protein